MQKAKIEGYNLGDFVQRKKVGLKGGQLVKLMQCDDCKIIKWANKNYVEPYMCQSCSARNRAKDNIDLNSFEHKTDCKCRRCRMGKGYFKGENNPMWNGGVKYIKGGYKMVWLPDGDPYISMTNSVTKQKNYVMEHRLVMAKHIGRPLTRQETVHHLNGIRDDNRIENLELWASNHQSGQRLKDQIKHAIELLTKNNYLVTKK